MLLFPSLDFVIHEKTWLTIHDDWNRIRTSFLSITWTFPSLTTIKATVMSCVRQETSLQTPKRSGQDRTCLTNSSQCVSKLFSFSWLPKLYFFWYRHEKASSEQDLIMFFFFVTCSLMINGAWTSFLLSLTSSCLLVRHESQKEKEARMHLCVKHIVLRENVCKTYPFLCLRSLRSVRRELLYCVFLTFICSWMPFIMFCKREFLCKKVVEFLVTASREYYVRMLMLLIFLCKAFLPVSFYFLFPRFLCHSKAVCILYRVLDLQLC